ncbi:MAG: hypothetical protein ACYC26_15000 [Phycisphaerales bacterium]
MTLKRVGVFSVGKVSGCLYVLLGLIAGAIISLLALAGAAISPDGQNRGPETLIFGVGAIILVPVFYGIMGFISGIIMAALYNLVAKVVGGIEMNIE